jgi:hypothetical protein
MSNESAAFESALVTVPATFHHESQIVLAREIDSRHDIGGRLDGYSVGAWFRCPGVDPAKGLGQPDLVTEIIGILQLCEDLRTARVRRLL